MFKKRNPGHKVLFNMRRQCKIFEKEGGKWCWRQRVVEVREYRKKFRTEPESDKKGNYK